MEWPELLSVRRTRELTGGRASNRAEVDHREEFERDFGRIVFSTPFRRLQDKTQVFPMDPNDSVRTRLTHSSEVSSVARGIGRRVEEWLVDSNRISNDFLRKRGIETICASVGLLHDFGNPPFGHAGEAAVQGWFAERLKDPAFLDLFGDVHERADFEAFEGNAQTLRLIGKLQVLLDLHGLNLSAAAFGTAIKYVDPSHKVKELKASLGEGEKAPHERSKPGYFKTEEQLVRTVRKELGIADGVRHPLAYLVEAADDAVYAFADIEDGVRKRVVTWAHALEQLKTRVGDSDPVLADLITRSERDGQDVDVDSVRSQLFRTYAIAWAADSALEVFRSNYQAIMAGKYSGELLRDEASKIRPLIKAAKDFARERVYTSSQTLELELRGRKVLMELLDMFLEGAREPTKPFGRRLYALTSPNYRVVYEDALQKKAATPGYLQVQLAVDQVTGMTDSFACSLHARLTN